MALTVGLIYFCVWLYWFTVFGLIDVWPTEYTYQNGRYRKRTAEEAAQLKRTGARACLYSFVWPIVVVVALVVTIVDGISWLFETADFGGKK